jgi:RHS repeat-associated protein
MIGRRRSELTLKRARRGTAALPGAMLLRLLLLAAACTNATDGPGIGVMPGKTTGPGAKRDSAANSPAPPTQLTVPSDALIAADLTGSANPDGSSITPGGMEGSFSVSADGQALYHVPLWVPAGRAGIQPALALDYQSRGPTGLLGVGWSLTGLHEISRCQHTYAQDSSPGPISFTASDSFCLDGQRLILTKGTYGADASEYHTEVDSFALVTVAGADSYGPSTFKAFLKDGRIFSFGTSVSGQRTVFTSSAPNGTHSTGRLSWLLTQISDRPGNALTITYQVNPVSSAVELTTGYEVLPQTINYTSTSENSQTLRSVKFFYSPRPDIQSHYVAGFKIVRTQRLSRIEMWGPQPSAPALLRYYSLTYADSSNGLASISRQSLLLTIEECISDLGGSNVCKAPTNFKYEMGALNYTDSATGFSFNPVGTAPCPGNPLGCVAEGLVAVGDVNGDGADDLVFRDYQKPNDPNGGVRLSLVTSTGSLNSNPTLGSAQVLTNSPDTLHDFTLLDVNGDGKADLAQWQTVSPSNGSGFGASYPLGVQMDSIGDLDGDGRPDFFGANPATGFRAYQLNTATGPGTVVDIPFSLPAVIFPPLLGDLFGAGKSGELSDSLSTFKVYITMQNGVLGNGIDINLPNSPVTQDAIWFVDLNGDGLPDVITVPLAGGFPTYSINTGSGYTPPIALPGNPSTTFAIGPVAIVGNNGYQHWDPGIRIVDLNGDGREDILVLGGSTWGNQNGTRASAVAYISTGDSSNPFVYQTINIPTSAIPVNQLRGNVYSTVLDVNGDGMADVVAPQCSGLGVSCPAHLYARNGNKPDMMTSFSTGMGAATTVTYAPTNKASAVATSDGNCAYPFRCLNRAMWVVAQVASTSGANDGSSSPTHTVKYQYANGLFDVGGRGFLGFEQRIVTDLNAHRVTTETFNPRFANGASGPPYYYPFVGQPQLVSTLYSNGSDLSLLLNETYTAVNNVSMGITQEYHFLSMNTELHQEFEGTAASSFNMGSPTRSVTTTLTPNGYGSITQRDIRTGDGYHRSETYTYGQDNPASGVWLVGRPTKTVVSEATSAQDTVTRTTWANYDPNGLLDAEQIEPSLTTDSTLYLSISYARTDSLAPGLVTVVTQMTTAGPLNPSETRTQTVFYDSLEHQFPIGVQNSLGQNTSLVYHPGLSALVLMQDANGVQAHYTLDLLGRPRGQRIQNTDGSVTSNVEKANYIPGASGTGYGMTMTSPTAVGEVDYDVFGRPTQTSVVRSEKTARAATHYNDLGQIVARSAPYFVGGGESFITYNYDVRGRLKLLTRPGVTGGGSGSTVAVAYSGLNVYRFDEKRRVSCKAFDQAGNLVLEGDLPGNGSVSIQGCQGAVVSGELRTTYTYWPFHHLKSKTDPLGLVSSYTVDTLGRVTGAQEPDNFTTSMSFDAFGDVRTQTAADNRYTEFGHDTLGRITTITSAPNSSSAVDMSWIYNWDTAVHGIGRLANASSPDGVQVAYGYNDPLSRQTSEAWTIQSTVYTLGRFYDSTTGRLAGLSYPSVGTATFAVNYGYDTAGAVNLIENAATSAAFWTRNTRNASGLVTSETLGNGLLTNRQYDELNQLRFLTTSTATQQLQELAYEYDVDGNVTARHDLGEGTSEEFNYDGYDRLVTWTTHQRCVTAPATVQYNYDNGGDIVSRQALTGPEQTVSYSYGYQHPGGSAPAHGISTSTVGATTTTYQYDLNGFQKGNGVRTATFKPFGLPATVVQGSTMATFQYGPFGERVFKSFSNGDSITYVGGLYERRVISGQTTHVFKVVGESGAVAEVVWTPQATLQGINYLSRDRLGSVETVTNSAALLVEHRKYEPFGERRNPANLSLPVLLSSSGDDEGFESHNLDAEFDLVDMGGRTYDPHVAHFLTPDIIASGNRVASQRHNRFGYALNNPLRYVDPSGFGSEDGGDGPTGPSAGPGPDTTDPTSGNPIGYDGQPDSIDLGNPQGILTAVITAPSVPTPATPTAPSSDGNGTTDKATAQAFLRGVVSGLAQALPGLAMGVPVVALSVVSAPLAGATIVGLVAYSAINAYINGGWGGVADALVPIRPFLQASSEFRTAVNRGDLVVAGSSFIRASMSGLALAGIALGAGALGGVLGEAGQLARFGTVGETADTVLAETAAETQGSQYVYRTGSQTERQLTDPSGVSFRDSISSTADPHGQVFRPGDKIFAVDTGKLPPGSVTFDGSPAGHVSVRASPGEIQSAIVPQGPTNPLSEIGLMPLEDLGAYRLPKK